MEKTKLIATVSENENQAYQIEEFIKNGIDVIRINMSYTTREACKKIIEQTREINKKLNTNVSILIDLEGPCVRTGSFVGGSTLLNTDDKIRIFMNEVTGNMAGFSVNYKGLIDDLKYKSLIKLSKGNVELEVIEKGLDYAVCEVLKGGEVFSNSKMYFPTTKLHRKFLTEQDKEDILFAHEMQADYIVASSISSAEDVLDINDILIELMDEHITLLAKIENKSAVDDLDNIINVSDGIILDRGDLGIEIPIEKAPSVQRKVINKCYEKGKLTIITAEFNSFLTKKNLPNRAEVSDLANLVSNAIDAIMLTSETTIGLKPIKTVNTMKKIIKSSEDVIDYNYFFKKSLETESKTIASTISSSVTLSANELDCKAILVATNLGNTVKRISKLKPPCPIIAATENINVVHSLGLYFGVMPILAKGETLDEITEDAKKKQ